MASRKEEFLVVYRYNSQGKADPVIRRREFGRLSLEELDNIHLPVPPNVKDITEETQPQQMIYKRITTDYTNSLKEPLMSKRIHFPLVIPEFKPRRKQLKIATGPEKRKSVHAMHLFSSANSPQPISTMFNSMPGKKILKIASVGSLFSSSKLKKSVKSLQQLVAYQDKYRSTLQSQELRRLPPRKRFKIWDSPINYFRMI